MVSRRENMKRYIKLIVDQLPQHFNEYSKEDQAYLEYFIDPLRYSEEADFKRKILSQRFQEARKFFTGHDLYLSYPFFWFADSYFENAEVSLITSSFHADNFYDYLLPILRGKAGEDNGVFQLIRKKIPLSDLKWEELQYRSAKLHVPLKAYELNIIKTVYSQLRTKPLHILKSRRVRSKILNQYEIPKLSSQLPKLFAILNSRWTVWPNYPAFGIQSYFFQFHIRQGKTLAEIIDFQTKKSGILSTSSVYSKREAKNEYLGIMHLPDGSEQQISEYLEKKKLGGEIVEFLLVPVTENRWTYSLAQYQTESGWQELNRSSWMRKVRLMKLKSLPRRRKKIELEYMTPVKDREWNYRNLEHPLDAINLICKKNIFDYSDLLSDVYTADELNLLKVLIRNHSIFIDFFPYRLGAEYSLDFYLIETPNLDFYQLKRLLELLPTARIASTSNKYYIFAYLSAKMAKQIRKDLDWPLYALLPTHTAAKRTLEMFDKELLKWHSPKILAD